MAFYAYKNSNKHLLEVSDSSITAPPEWGSDYTIVELPGTDKDSLINYNYWEYRASGWKPLPSALYAIKLSTGELLAVSDTEITIDPEWGGDFEILTTHLSRAELYKDYYWDAYTHDWKLKSKTLITFTDFINRFTSAERIAIRDAIGTDNKIDDFMYLIEFTNEVKLNEYSTISNVEYFAEKGLIEYYRISEILQGG